jgi:hypothetical protein
LTLQRENAGLAEKVGALQKQNDEYREAWDDLMRQLDKQKEKSQHRCLHTHAPSHPPLL